MLQMLSLRTKLFVFITTAVLVTFSAVIYIVSDRSAETVKQSLYETTLETAGKFGYQMKAEFEASRTVALTMKSVFEALKNAGVTDRTMMDTILTHILDADEKMLSLCLGYEPNALDGRDAEFVNVTPGHDKTGRYLPYVYRDKGEVLVEPLVDYETADWYQVPKRTLKEYLPDPFPYKVAGKDTMLVSFLFPLMHQNNFMGIVSADITLDRLQEMVREIKPFGTGSVAVLSNNGTYAAHIDAQYLNKQVLNKEARNAIKAGKQYIDRDGNFFTMYMPIRFTPETPPWSVAVRVSEQQVLGRADEVRRNVIGVSAIGLMVIVLLLFWITRNVTEPLQSLAGTATRLGQGDFDAPIGVPPGKDEIGALAQALQVMAQKINSLVGDLKQHATELEQTNANLKQLGELKDQFLANTSHELRTPINGIVGIVESMLDGAAGALSPEQKYNLTLVSRSGRRLSHLINDIVDFTKLKSREIELNRKAVDLRQVVEMIFATLQPLVTEEDLKLHNEIPDNLPPVDADENRIHQVLYNLVDNAIKFTNKGGVTITAEAGNGQVILAVEDTGIGIPQDKLGKIFDAFEQADGSISREYGGTGLGLSISRRLLELHGSTIEVTSTVGRGSRFAFALPAVDGQPAPEARTVPAQVLPMVGMDTLDLPNETDGRHAASSDTRRIVIVDDEPINIQVLKNVLGLKGYDVTPARSGPEALRLIADQPGFDLVLLDLMMPQMSGYEVCKRLREEHSLFELPILILTAKNQLQDIVLGFKAGANDYVQKPFEMQELLARVGTLLMLKKAVGNTMDMLVRFEGEQQKRMMAETLHEVMHKLTATLQLQSVLQNVIDAVPKFTEFERAVVVLREHDHYEIKTSTGYRPSVPVIGTHIELERDNLIARVIATRETVFADSWGDYAALGSNRVAGIPITYAETVQGVLIVEGEDVESNADWLSALAGQAGAAIENARLFETIQNLATTDELTGLNNRRYFFEIVQREHDRFERYGHPVAVLMIDIDNFKNFNDKYGHAVGDQVLAHVSQTLTESVRNTDIVGRYGGEEIAILLPHTTLDTTLILAEKFRAAVASSKIENPEHGTLGVTVSIGASTFTAGADVAQIVESADQALYTAKNSGRNCVVCQQVTV